MKQLLIVKSGKALNAGLTSGDVTDLSGLEQGAITFFELGGSTALSAKPTKNFAIALGCGSNSTTFVIPEVDIKTLNVTKTVPVLGKAFKRTFTVPTTVAGTEYTLLFAKKGVVFNERSNWHVSAVATDTTAAKVATALKTAIEANLGDKFTVTVASAKVTITAKTIGEGWELKLVDGLAGVAFSTTSGDNVDAEPTVGDKAYVQDLASRCAAGKGFTDTYADGDSIYPGYPEAVEDLVVNASGTGGASTAGYVVYTLRFNVGRDASKTRDERVSQLVHIAAPIAIASSIDAIIPEGNFLDNAAFKASTQSSGSNG